MTTFVNRLRLLLSRTVRDRALARSVAVLAGGTALGQGLAVLASPFLTRLCTPSGFGVLSAYTAIFSILVVVASLRYELAIPLPEDDETAANLLVLSGLICCSCPLAFWEQVFIKHSTTGRCASMPSARLPRPRWARA